VNASSTEIRAVFTITRHRWCMPTPTLPFSHLLVPYDGSEPARAALRLAIEVARGGAAISVVTIVDETPLMAQSTTTMVAFDPTPLMDALDAEGRALLQDAAEQCRAESIEPSLAMVHERPVAGIISAADAGPCDLIVIGTHARRGVARTFLGSTTEGVLRSSRIPVLTVRSADRLAGAPFATALVALDDSEPADAAAAVVARLVRLSGSAVIACHAIDSNRMLENAAALSLSYGYRPANVADDLRREAVSIVNGALTRAGLPENTTALVVDGEAAQAIITAADDHSATVIVVGTHGRRGLRRLALGSVAESIVRASDIPVLVVPATSSR
jgi:nucleotide-binding universal stress UspA family protein